MNAIEVRDAIHNINAREKNLEVLEGQTRRAAQDWLSEIIIQGTELIRLKAAVQRGAWKELFDSGRLKINYLRATYCMRIAARPYMVDKDCPSFTRAVQLLEVKRESTLAKEVEAKRWPGQIECLARASRLVRGFNEVPATDWKPGTINRLKVILEPVRVKLWP